MPSAPGRSYAFVVRLRLERDSAEPAQAPTLRGSVQQVGSADVRYFAAWGDVARLLQELTAASDESHPASNEA